MLGADLGLWATAIGASPRILLSASSIAEDAANGASIGTLSVVGGSGTYTFSINSDPDGVFAVSGGALDKNGALDYEVATAHRVQIKADNGNGSILTRWFTINVGNVAPMLSNPIDTKSGPTSAYLAVDTTESNGTLWWVVATSATPPTAAQIKAGQDSSGVAAAASGSLAISAAGTHSLAVSGLTAGTAYTAHFMHEETSLAQSNIASGDGFTTASAGSWQTTLTNTLTNDYHDGTTEKNYSARVVAPAASLSISGGLVRVTFDAPSAYPFVVAHASIVERSSVYAGTRAPTELKFSGVSGFSIAAGASIVSDGLEFSLDETKDYLVIVDTGATNGGLRRLSGGQSYFKGNASSYDVQSPTGFTGTAQIYFVSKIEIYG